MKITVLCALTAVSALGFAQDGKKVDGSKNKFGGPVYTGAPALSVTSALVEAGGGIHNFSIATALGSMVGADTVKAEMASLIKRYGERRVNQFVDVFDFAVKDAFSKEAASNVALPEGNLSGKDLAATLVKEGEDNKGVFWTDYLLDKTVNHKIHMQVMRDIESKFGTDANEDYHRISNQTHYDLAKVLGIEGVKRASLH